jgi:hypothetical protein
MMDVFRVMAHYLIEFMALALAVALSIRYVTYRAGVRDSAYFSSFSRAVEKIIESENRETPIGNLDQWLTGLLERVVTFLPDRTVRHTKVEAAPAEAGFKFRGQEAFAEYAEGKRSILHAIRAQSDVLRSPTPPNFWEVSHRVLEQDRRWQQVMGMSVSMLSRILDILPGLFVVGGIFGTFIEMAASLPKLATIDLAKINESAPILNAFISNVANSMKCSIAGIFFSVVMTILNALFPIHAARSHVHKDLERCLEIMWYRVHGNKISLAESKMIGLLELIERALHGVPNPEIVEDRAS